MPKRVHSDTDSDDANKQHADKRINDGPASPQHPHSDMDEPDLDSASEDSDDDSEHDEGDTTSGSDDDSSTYESNSDGGASEAHRHEQAPAQPLHCAKAIGSRVLAPIPVSTV